MDSVWHISRQASNVIFKFKVVPQSRRKELSSKVQLPTQERKKPVVVTQSCLTLCDPVDGSHQSCLCPWDLPGKRTGVGCPFPSPDGSGSPREADPVSHLPRCRRILPSRSPQGSPGPHSHPGLRPGALPAVRRVSRHADPQERTAGLRGPSPLCDVSGEAAAWLRPQQVPCSNTSLPRGGKMALFSTLPHRPLQNDFYLAFII